MKILIKTLKNQTLELEVDTNDFIEQLKQKINDQLGYHPNTQRLAYSGKALLDGFRLSDFNIVDGSIVYVVCSIQGG